MEKRLEKGFGSSDTEPITNGLSQVQLPGYVHSCTCHRLRTILTFAQNVFYHSHITCNDLTFRSEGGEDIDGVSGEKVAKPVTPVQDCVSTFIRKCWANFQPVFEATKKTSQVQGILIQNIKNKPYLTLNRPLANPCHNIT